MIADLGEVCVSAVSVWLFADGGSACDDPPSALIGLWRDPLRHRIASRTLAPVLRPFSIFSFMAVLDTSYDNQIILSSPPAAAGPTVFTTLTAAAESETELVTPRKKQPNVRQGDYDGAKRLACIFCFVVFVYLLQLLCSYDGQLVNGFDFCGRRCN